MLALSPPCFSPFGLPVDDQMSYDNMNWAAEYDVPLIDCVNHESDNSHLQFSPLIPEAATEDPKQSPVSGDDPSSVKKLSHNANERDRRKRLNALYSTLRSMLPEMNPKKKLSIPATVSDVLKYIPELEKQVKELEQKKKEILSKITRHGDSYLRNSRTGAAYVPPSPTVSVTAVDDREVVVQICNVDEKASPLSKVVQSLEEEGLNVLNASSFAAVGGRAFYSLHFQVKDNMRMDCEKLRQTLLSLYENWEDFSLY